MKIASKIPFLILGIVLLNIFTSQAKNFVHPGLSHKLSDLERMKYMVKVGKEPWKTSFANLQANPYASYNYTPKWSLDSTRVVEGWASNYNKLRDDVTAAYYNSLEWYITGDARYAEKSIQIINTMRNIRSIVTATQSLCAGRYAGKLVEAAEIIKSTYPGWKKADIDAFKAMLVYPGYSTKTDHSTDVEHSFYWAMFQGDYARAGNQGLFGFHGTLAIAIFMDNEIMYDRIVRNMKGLKHRSDDLPYPGGPTIRGNQSSSNRFADVYVLQYPYTTNSIADYGFNEQIQYYIWANGQSQEASRDQVHSILGVNLVNQICEIAWNQGDDIYSWMDYRPLLGFEYYFRYNLSADYSFTDQPNSWEPTAATGEFIQGWDRSGRSYQKMNNPYQEGAAIDSSIYLTRDKVITEKDDYGGRAPIFEMTLAHYKNRMNLPSTRYKWLMRADSISKKQWGYEQFGNRTVGLLGYGGLTFHRTDSCPGDPVTFVNKVPVYRQNIAPCTVQAEDYDFMTTKGQGRTFYDLSGTKIANDYRPDSTVTIKPCSAGGYKVSDMASSEWLRYSVYIPEYSKYSISINYASVNANGKIKLRIGSQDKTTEISLPATGSNVWSDYTLITDTLFTGIRSVQLIVSGESNAIELNSIKIEKAMIPAKNDYISYRSGDYNTAANWRYSDGNGGVQSSAPSTAPTTSNNVWVQTGHVMTATTADVNAKNLFIPGTLTVGNGTATSRNITLGTASVTGSLYVLSTGILASTTSAGSVCDNINVYGGTISNFGRIGSVNSTTTTGSGLRFFCYNPDKTTFMGTGIMNVAGVQVGSAIVSAQQIVIDMDMNLMNTNTAAATLSLLNGSSEAAIKTLTINEGKSVTFAGGASCLLHQQASDAAQTVSGGDFNYNINGTLNTGIGGLYLTTANVAASSSQSLNLTVGSKGTLIIGGKFFMNKPYTTQSINFNFASGSLVQYSGIIAPTMMSTSVSGILPFFPTAYSKLTIDNPKGISLLAATSVDSTLALKRGVLILGANNLTLNTGATIIGATDTTHIVTNGTGTLTLTAKSGTNALFPVGVSSRRYDPAIVSPTSDATFTVRADSVFDIVPLHVLLTNPTEWTISSATNVSGNLTLKPSVATAINSPIVAQLVNNAWVEADATYSVGSFTIPLSSSTVFGTGNLTGFGLKSALDDAKWGQLISFTKEKNLFIKGLSVGDDLFVYNTTGQLVARLAATGSTENIALASKGVYVIEIKNENFNKTIKIIIK